MQESYLKSFIAYMNIRKTNVKKKRLSLDNRVFNYNGRGNRIRTRTKGFGDPCATIDTMPLEQALVYHN